MNPVFVFLGAGAEQAPLIEHATNVLGMTTLAVDGSPQAVGLRQATRPLVSDICNPSQIVEHLKGQDVSGCIAHCIDVSQRSAHAVAQTFDLPANPLKAIECATSKVKLKGELLAHDVPVARAVSFTSADDLKTVERKCAELTYPLLVKPSDSSASRGVSVVNTAAQLEAAFSHALSFSRNQEGLVEEFFQGELYSVEMLAWSSTPRVLALSRCEKFPGTLVNSRIVVSTSWASEVEQRIAQLGQRAAEAIGLRLGPAHAEVIWDSSRDRCILVEIAARGGGVGIFNQCLKEFYGPAVFDVVLSQALQPRFRNSDLPSADNWVQRLQGRPGHSSAEITFPSAESKTKMSSGVERPPPVIRYS